MTTPGFNHVRHENPARTERVSFLISTYNRKQVTLHTLDQLRQSGLTTDAHEVIVIDNASLDGTADAIRLLHPEVRLIEMRQNRGPCAKNAGIPLAQGEFIVFLDDDSYPDARSIARMLHHFANDPKLGAAVFTVTLPDGSRECSAYPDVFIGCGTGFRKSALEQVGGLPEDFFMQAEEYDLSLRLLEAGWRVRTFHDLHVTHLKTPGARFSQRVTRLDVRNNLTLIARHFPEEWVWPFAWDWMRRYYAIAAVKGHRKAYFHGLFEGFAELISPSQRQPVNEQTFETFAKINQTEDRLAAVKRQLGLQKAIFIDLGKNMLPFYRAARRCGLKIEAVADPKLAPTARSYRNIPVMDDSAAANLAFDAAIISNLSPVHAQLRLWEWKRLTNRPVIDLFTAAQG